MILEVHNLTSIGLRDIITSMNQGMAKHSLRGHMITPMLLAPQPSHTLSLQIAEYALQLVDLERVSTQLTVYTNYTLQIIFNLVINEPKAIWSNRIAFIYKQLHTNFGVPPAKAIAVFATDDISDIRHDFYKACQLAMLPVYVFNTKENTIAENCKTFLDLAFESRGEE